MRREVGFFILFEINGVAQMLNCGIYAITNLVNGKRYVGQGINIKKRWMHHRSDLRGNYHHNKHLQAAWYKYGEQSFCFEIIEECSESDLVSREDYWITFYKTLNYMYGYNEKEAGSNGRHTKATRLKMSASHRGKHVGNKNHMFGKSVRRKITENIAMQIIELLLNKVSIFEIANKLGIQRTIIENIKYKKSWKKLTSDLVFPECKTNFMIGNKHTKEAIKKIRQASKRQPCGENNPCALITENVACQIIKLLKKGLHIKEIVQELHVKEHFIKNIKYKKAWKHLTKDIDFPKCKPTNKKIVI